MVQTEDQSKMEEEMSNEGKKTFRQILDRLINTNKRKLVLQSVISFISLASYLLYVICTYFPFVRTYLNYSDIGVCAIYTIEYVINFFLAHHRFNYILTSGSIIDLITLIPPFFTVNINIS